MTHYIRGSTVEHVIDAVDWRREHAVAVCGAEGEPVELDEPGEVCGNCKRQLDDA